MYAFGIAPDNMRSRLSSARAGIEELLPMAGASDKPNLNALMTRQIDLEMQAQIIDPANTDYMQRLDQAIDKQLTQVSNANKAVYTGSGVPVPDVSRVPMATRVEAPRASAAVAAKEMMVPGSTSTIIGRLKSSPYLMPAIIGIGAIALLTFAYKRRA